MDKDVRRSIDTGTRTETFWGAHAITNPDLSPLLTRLTSLLDRGRELAIEQRAKRVERTGASAWKRELERTIRTLHVPHLSRAGAQAVSDDPELGTITFRLAPSSGSFAAFRTAVGMMADSAEQHRAALIKHGMGPTVLNDLGGALKEFDLAVERGNKARAAHVEATAQLTVVAADIMKVVRMMDGIARLEFRNDPGLLATWKSVSRRQAVPQTDAGESGGSEPPAGPSSQTAGGVRPAA